VKTDIAETSLIVAQIDGSMVPIVNYSEATKAQKEKGLKKDRDCHWREFRLCAASIPESLSKNYGVVLGSPLEAGCMMYQTCQQLGLGSNTHIHGVGDGAPWIKEQYEEQFGMNHNFYIDFYHVSEYLGEAYKEIKLSSLEGLTRLDWQRSRKAMLLEGKAQELINELKISTDQEKQECMINKAYQYLSNRIDHLNYPIALKANLPIGSGEVESAHRSILQARLKQPGAWWKLNNAENMAHLKVLQANGHWEEFWQQKVA